MPFLLNHTQITIEEFKDPVIFFNLSINQYLADVNSFNFTLRHPKDNDEPSFQSYLDFYKKCLSKQVVINITEGDGGAIQFTFIGFIYAITCTGNDDMATSYDISGKGIFAKLDEISECSSYYRESIQGIIDKISTGFPLKKMN
ncbi:hypothetical protein [Niabella ginsengisoli]|uniref:Uncharacterized protein n=1 Tax=Niabella ginsengisoli TaxID=522298 RepID=A0ABS9SGR1_9BACT|nr:hypothetical protein [Niabella ginsengisoli]MCH5597552.1 hypothetical protein [Niabella ginsengisoli]